MQTARQTTANCRKRKRDPIAEPEDPAPTASESMPEGESNNSETDMVEETEMFEDGASDKTEKPSKNLFLVAHIAKSQKSMGW